MNEPLAPVIVIGMHRSGTSLVTRMLSELGLFTGWRKDRNHEPWFFLRLNDWLFHQSGGAWDQPAAIRYLRDDPDGRRVVADYLRFQLATPRAVDYLGVRRYARYHAVSNLDHPWGWKDPRNTFTLPFWLDLFPEARVVHVHRHGVDVAASLQRRQRQSIAAATRRFRRRRPLHRFLLKQGGFAESWRCGRLEDALSLWQEYVTEADARVHALGAQALTVCYEDLLNDPQPHLERLTGFCGLAADPDTRARVAGRVHASRAYAYREDPALRAFAERSRDELASFGY